MSNSVGPNLGNPNLLCTPNVIQSKPSHIPQVTQLKGPPSTQTRSAGLTVPNLLRPFRWTT